MSYVRRAALLAAASVAAALLTATPAVAAPPDPAAPQPAPTAPTPPAPTPPRANDTDTAPAGPAEPARRGEAGPPELVGTYQRVAKDIVQPDGNLRDVYDDLLVTGSRTYRLRLPKGLRLQGNTPVRVRGTIAGADVTAEQVQATGASEAPATTGTTKVLVILAHWSAPDSVTVAQARNQIFTDGSAWFGEVSYGQLSLAGDVSGWHKITPPTDGKCYGNHMEVMDRAKAKAKAAGYDSALYGRTIVYFPRCGGDAAGTAGWAYVPGDEAWLNGYMDRRVSVHEQGHNYGLWHAHTFDCRSGGERVSLSGSCSFTEYGDDYDAMGGSDHTAHFGAPQKDQLGWLSGRKRSLTSAKTTFTLPPFEKVGSTPVAAVTGTTVTTRKYWIEHRQAVGYDNTLPAGATGGVLVRMTDTALTAGRGPYLLDMSPQNAWEHAVIPPGGAWTSPEGVRISVGSVTASGAAVTVEGGVAPPVVPSAPRNVSATGGDGTVRLTWDPPASNGGATVQSYVVTRTPGGVTTTVEGTSETVAGLTNGAEYAFTVAARNAAGLGPASAAVTAVPAAQLPSVVVTAPAGGTTVGGEVQLAASATPHPVSGAPIDFVSFEVDGQNVGGDAVAPYAVTWDSSTVEDGTHVVTATAYDSSFRYRTSEDVTIEVRTPRPTVSITSPVAGAVITDDVVTLQATSAPAPNGGAPIQWLTYELADGTTIGYADATAPHTAQWDTTALNGRYDVVARVHDAAGRSGVSAPVRVTIQHPVPSVTLTAPAEGAVVRDTVTVAADAAPNAVTGAAISHVEFYAGNGAYLGAAYVAPYEVQWDTRALNGEQVVTAVAHDVTGRTATTPPRAVVVENPLPTVTVTSPSPDEVVGRGVVTLAATPVADPAGGSPIARVEFTIDGWLLAGSVEAPGPYSVSWDPNGAYGRHTLVATAYDAAGRPGSSAPVSFTVPYPAPTAVVSAPADGSTIRSGPTTIRVTTAPDVQTQSPVTLVEFYVDDRSVGWDDTPADGFTTTWQATTGDHVLSAMAMDETFAQGYSRGSLVTVADPPGAPTAVIAAKSATNTATVSWTPPAVTGGQPILGYVVRGSDGAEFSDDASPFEVTGLTYGRSYTFQVRARTSVGLGPFSTASNAVVPGTPTALSVAVSPTTVEYGKPVTVTGRLAGAEANDPLAGRTVQLLACAAGTASCASVAKSAVTATDGTVAFSYVPRAHRDLYLRYVATGDKYLAARTAAKRVQVRAVVTSAVSRTSVVLGGTFAMSGRVTPAHGGLRVYLQRYTSAGWRNVTYLAQTSTGAVSFVVKPSARGTFRYRLHFAGHTDHLAGTSPARTVKVT